MNSISVRRLQSGDESILRDLAQNYTDFEVEGHNEAESFDLDSATKYLANPHVLVWVAEAKSQIIGSLHCYQLLLPSNAGHELLLYEIGVHRDWRRHGVGRALVTAMDNWMHQHNVPEVWVLADTPGAVEFYLACGFTIEEDQPRYMTRLRSESAHPSL